MSVLRTYDPAGCSADGKPLDWERCRQCAGDGYLLFNYGHTVEPDGSLGGRGMRSTPCEPCAGHGSLKAAALAHMRYGTCVDVGRLDASVGREPRCEDCGHPMSDGTWEGNHPRLDVLLSFALTELREGYEPRTGIFTRSAPDSLDGPTVVHYSPCDGKCRHSGSVRVHNPDQSIEAPHWSGALDFETEVRHSVIAGMSVEASWRPVDIRTLGWPHDLRPERLAVLCLRCFAERTRPTTAGTAL